MKKGLLKPSPIDDKLELDVPGDNSCLFWAAAMAYLIPVLNDMKDFTARFTKLFGENKIPMLMQFHQALQNYNPFNNTSIYDNFQIKNLTRETFRSRVINHMADNEALYAAYCDVDFKAYCLKMHQTDSWGGDLEIRAISGLLGCNILLHQNNNKHQYPDGFEHDADIILVHANCKGQKESANNHYHYRLASTVYRPGVHEEEKQEQEAKHDKETTPSTSRRLDSLARLLEFKMTCAAVCLIDDTVYITTNDIYALTIATKSKTLTPIESATKHFLNDDFYRPDEYTDKDIAIILSTYKGKLATELKQQYTKMVLGDDALKKIIRHLLDAPSTRAFMGLDTTLHFFTQFLSEESSKPTVLFEQQLKVQHCFNQIWRDVRDYKKFKRMVIQRQNEGQPIKRYCVLAIGSKDEHAEMRMLSYLLTRADIFEVADKKLVLKEPLYLGISKLCCPHCFITLKVLNEQIIQSPALTADVDDIGELDGSNILSSEEALAASIEQDAEKMRDALLGVRGGHDLPFKWTFPAFAREITTKHEHWPCEKVKEKADLDKCHGEETLYYVGSKASNVKCLINIEACIIKDKKVFSVGALQMKFTLKKSEIKDNQVSIKKLKQLCNTLYTPGFHAKTLTLSREADASEIVISWDDLGASKVEAEHLACLVENQCHECMVEAYDLINQGVETKVQVKMVASASSSSIEDELPDTLIVDKEKELLNRALPADFKAALDELNISSARHGSKPSTAKKSIGSSAEEGQSSDSDLLNNPESSEGSFFESSEDSSEEEDSSSFGIN